MDTASPSFTIGRDLVGQAAVVTGSSSGIGRAIALRLAAAGADCLVHGYVHADSARATAKEVERLGGHSHIVLANLAEPTEQDRLVAEAFAWRPDISIWINNAGADVLTGSAAEWSFDQKLAELWRVDVTATIRIARQVGQRMAAGAGGSIVNMGWDQAEQGMAGDSGELFAAIKGAIMAFSRSLAQSLAPQVRVNCLAPGWIRTAWAEGASEDWQQRAVAESLLGRWGAPEDVAATAHFLVSPAAAFITGQIIAVNGGFRHGDFQRGGGGKTS
jgi:3-oxoacyl-[acyl-carrier protein] reductase